MFRFMFRTFTGLCVAALTLAVFLVVGYLSGLAWPVVRESSFFQSLLGN